MWDVFQVVQREQSDLCGDEFWQSVRRVVKVILSVFMFAVVVCAAVTSKLCLFLIVGYISDNTR